MSPFINSGVNFVCQLAKMISALADLIFVDLEISNVGVTLIDEDFPDVFLDLRLDHFK